jgi:hypothetical protein
LTFKNKFFIIALENHISNGGFALNYFKQIYLTKPQNFSKSRWLEWGSWRGKPIEGTQPTTHGGGPATFPAPWWKTKIQTPGNNSWIVNTSTLSEFKNIYNRNITKIGADVDDTDPLYPNVIFSFPNLCYFDPSGCQGRTKYATYTLVFKGKAVKDGSEEEITKPGFSSTTIVNVPLIYLPPPPKINLSINTKYDTATKTTQIDSENYYIFAVTTTEEFKPFSDFLKNSNGKLTYNPFYGLSDDDVCSVAFTTSTKIDEWTNWTNLTSEIIWSGVMKIPSSALQNLNLTTTDLILQKDEKIKVRLLKFLTMPLSQPKQKLISSLYIQNLFGSSTDIGGGRYLTKNLFKNIIKSVDNNAFDGDTLQIRFTCHQDYDENGYQNNNSTSTDMVEETLTFNLTPRSAVLIPKTTSEYTGQGTPKTATFNAKIHIVDASSTSEIYLKIKNNSNNPVTTTISNVTYPTTTQINGGQEKEVLIDNANKNKYIKTNIGIKFEYPDKSEITIWVFYNKYNKETKKAESIYLPDEGVTIQLK